MKKKLKVGVIGTGNISFVHIDAYKNNPDVELVALCDINPDVLAASGKRYGVNKLYGNYNDMFKENPDIDAVSVCTCNSEHAKASITALNLGKCVLCEKPMAISVAEAEEMLKASESGKGRLMMGFVRRFGNDAAIAKDFIDNGHLGEIYYAKATYIRRNGNPGGWFSDKARSGGGPLIDLGVHVIDLVRYLSGSPAPKSVYGATFNKLGERPYEKGEKSFNWTAADGQTGVCDVEDMASAMIRFDNKMVLQVETSFSLHTGADTGKIELYGTKGGLVFDPEMTFYTKFNGYPVNMSVPFSTALSFDGLFQNEIDHFVDCALTGKPFQASAQDGVVLMEILEAAYKSAASEREVILT